MIFGRKNCNYNKDWVVRINAINKQRLNVAEQLRKEEAIEIYNQVKEKLKDKEDFIEISTEIDVKDNALEFFLKRNILSVEILRS